MSWTSLNGMRKTGRVPGHTTGQELSWKAELGPRARSSSRLPSDARRLLAHDYGAVGKAFIKFRGSRGQLLPLAVGIITLIQHTAFLVPGMDNIDWKAFQVPGLFGPSKCLQSTYRLHVILWRYCCCAARALFCATLSITWGSVYCQFWHLYPQCAPSAPSAPSTPYRMPLS